MIYDNPTNLIGNTPIVKLNDFESNSFENINIYLKLEMLNPSGSIKDRVALNMIEKAKIEGKINEESTIIAPTSGNTGIGLAFVCAALKLKLIICMPETMSLERQKILRAYGAELILTDGSRGMQGSVERAKELAMVTDNSYLAEQFTDKANIEAHFEHTAQEIINDLNGQIDAFVAGIGSSGTIVGVGRALKQLNPDIKLYGVEPTESAILAGEDAGAHSIEGIGANFVPPFYDKDLVDKIIHVSSERALEVAHNLIQTKGLFVGISSGANVDACLQIAEKEYNLQNIVTVLPDSADRYFSTDLFGFK
ncbi:MAG: cysteine synthase A [Clostridia bacterium]|nr:cysteine synthase A [Clostridia bacterium]